MIEFKNVSKIYKPKKGTSTIALNDLSFNLPNKGLIFLTGKSGSGKSTLLNIIGSLDKATKGDIIINGKNINKFKNSEMDAYRNTYLGFIFQDFYLLDDYNVGKNIEIALNLQKKKLKKDYLSQILELVGLQGLENRKINELSGGQKQRVAIARAIIKNPNIILADEPTGNLDSETSEQIFTLLKQISKEKLVIVVTHEIEYAEKYGDRIIELKDGSIVKDTNINSYNIEIEEKKFVKAKLPFIRSLELAFSNLKQKKLRLFFTIILVTISLSLFGFSTILTHFDISKTHAETMIRENNSLVEIHKKIENQNFTTASPVITFTQNEITEVKEKLNTEIIPVSKIVENNSYLTISFAENINGNDELFAYYEFVSNEELKFLEYSEEMLDNESILGQKPSNSNEILIHKSLADYFLKYGMLIWNYDEKNNLITEDYLPQSYEEIYSSGKKLVFGSTYLIISGIIDEDMSKYEELKQISYDEIQINPSKIYDEFKAKYQNVTYEVIVNKDFFSKIQLIKNNSLSIDFYKTVYNFNDNNIYSYINTNLLDKEITVFDGDENIKISKLNDNEIIISSLFIDEMYNNEYSEGALKYLEEKTKEYENAVIEREKKLEEQEELLLIDPDLILEDIPEIEPIDNIKLMNSYLINYIKEKQIIGKTINLEINDLYLRTQDNIKNNYNDLTIIGIEIDGITNYLSSDILSSYMRENKETMYIYFNETNIDKLEKIFDEFPAEDSKYISKTIYTKDIINTEKTVNYIKVIAYYLSFGFLFFSVILFINFMIASINSYKRKIGILRALGAKKKDILKIFSVESLIISSISFILSSLICLFGSKISNEIISQNLFFNIQPIIFRTNTVIYLVITIIVLILISSILPIIKIAKMKPVDAIK